MTEAQATELISVLISIKGWLLSIGISMACLLLITACRMFNEIWR